MSLIHFPVTAELTVEAKIAEALTFRDSSIVLDRVKGEPVYLILAMTPEKTIRLKPQNLATGLPIRHLEAVG